MYSEVTGHQRKDVFEIALVLGGGVSSRTARDIQRNPVSKKKKKQHMPFAHSLKGVPQFLFY